MLRRPTLFRFDDPSDPEESALIRKVAGQSDRHTFGSIVWMAMLRMTITIFVAWYILRYFGDAHYGEWWTITVGAIYGIVIYPAQIQYHHFKKSSKYLMEQTLCSSCRFFNADGLHCTKLDEHVSEDYLPCEGEGWEPKTFDDV